MEPTNPDDFYITTCSMTIDGKHVRAKVKQWYDRDEKQYKQRVLNTERDIRHMEEKEHEK